MSCSRTVTGQCRVPQGLVCLRFNLQSKRHFHPTLSMARTNDAMKRILQKERKASEAETKTSKKDNPRNPNYVKPAEKPVEKKRVTKSLYTGNPDAKFVFLHELEVRHVLHAERHVGEVLKFPDNVVSKLDKLGMLNKKQGFQFMRSPASMMRPNAGLVARELLADDVSHLGTKDRRVVVAGKGGSGKSFILLQMAALALMQNYVVVAVPRGMDLVDNRTAYSLDEKTMRFKQTEYMSNMLSRTKKACGNLLQNQTTSRRLRIGRDILAQGAPLISILESGELHPASSQEAFEMFLLEMGRPERPRMLFLFDNISAISVPSQIKSPQFPYRPVHPHRLWIPFFFTCLLNGTVNQPRAAVIAATSQHPAARTLDIALGQAEQKPYEPIDRRIPHSVDGASIIRAGDQLTTEEAIGLAAFYQAGGLLKTVDRFDGINKSVGDESYTFPESPFFIYTADRDETPTLAREPHAFRRRGRMHTGIVSSYIKRQGIVGKEDPTDIEATMERLALSGGTAWGFWKTCTRMSHF